MLNKTTTDRKIVVLSIILALIFISPVFALAQKEDGKSAPSESSGGSSGTNDSSRGSSGGSDEEKGGGSSGGFSEPSAPGSGGTKSGGGSGDNEDGKSFGGSNSGGNGSVFGGGSNEASKPSPNEEAGSTFFGGIGQTVRNTFSSTYEFFNEARDAVSSVVDKVLGRSNDDNFVDLSNVGGSGSNSGRDVRVVESETSYTNENGVVVPGREEDKSGGETTSERRVGTVEGTVTVTYTDPSTGDRVTKDTPIDSEGVPVVSVPAGVTDAQVSVSANCGGDACFPETGNAVKDLTQAGAEVVEYTTEVTGSTVVSVSTDGIAEAVEIVVAGQAPVGKSGEEVEESGGRVFAAAPSEGNTSAEEIAEGKTEPGSEGTNYGEVYEIDYEKNTFGDPIDPAVANRITGVTADGEIILSLVGEDGQVIENADKNLPEGSEIVRGDQTLIYNGINPETGMMSFTDPNGSNIEESIPSREEIVQNGEELLARVTRTDGTLDSVALAAELRANPELIDYLDNRFVDMEINGEMYRVREYTIGDRALVGSPELAQAIAEITGRSIPTTAEANVIIEQSEGVFQAVRINGNHPGGSSPQINHIAEVDCVSNCSSLTAGTERKMYADFGDEIDYYGGRQPGGGIYERTGTSHSSDWADYSSGIVTIERIENTGPQTIEIAIGEDIAFPTAQETVPSQIGGSNGPADPTPRIDLDQIVEQWNETRPEAVSRSDFEQTAAAFAVAAQLEDEMDRAWEESELNAMLAAEFAKQGDIEASQAYADAAIYQAQVAELNQQTIDRINENIDVVEEFSLRYEIPYEPQRILTQSERERLESVGLAEGVANIVEAAILGLETQLPVTSDALERIALTLAGELPYRTVQRIIDGNPTPEDVQEVALIVSTITNRWASCVETCDIEYVTRPSQFSAHLSRFANTTYSNFNSNPEAFIEIAASFFSGSLVAEFGFDLVSSFSTADHYLIPEYSEDLSWYRENLDRIIGSSQGGHIALDLPNSYEPPRPEISGRFRNAFSTIEVLPSSVFTRETEDLAVYEGEIVLASEVPTTPQARDGSPGYIASTPTTGNTDGREDAINRLIGGNTRDRDDDNNRNYLTGSVDQIKYATSSIYSILDAFTFAPVTARVDTVKQNVSYTRKDLAYSYQNNDTYRFDTDPTAKNFLKNYSPIVYGRNNEIVYSNGLFAPESNKVTDTNYVYLFETIENDEGKTKKETYVAPYVSYKIKEEVRDKKAGSQDKLADKLLKDNDFREVIKKENEIAEPGIVETVRESIGLKPEDYTIYDVESVKYTVKEAKEPYTGTLNYKIKLNNGKKVEVETPEVVNTETAAWLFGESGFSGNAIVLMNMADYEEKPSRGESIWKALRNIFFFWQPDEKPKETYSNLPQN